MGLVHLEVACVPASDHPLPRPLQQQELQLEGKRELLQQLPPKFAKQFVQDAK